ncbi:MAG: DUF2203 domain-containing protein [Planctomycetota bacterium]|nr:DUF2203 domain-containing protein [Planctomycetota bacterium]
MGTGIRTLFSVDEANQILPLVRSIVRDVVNDFRELRAAGRERRAMEVETAGGHSAHQHIEALKDKVDVYSARIESYLRELGDLGLEVRDLELGLVDFPSLIDGEPAYLSWRLGEEDVSWWHPADKGFSDRTPVPLPLGMPPSI